MQTGNDFETKCAALEQEIRQKQQELLDLKRSIAHDVADDYEFVRWDGSTARLSDLFGEKDDLIIVHNMGRRCSYCTLWADGFNGVYPHLADRASFVVVSPDPIDVEQSFAGERGWRFPMISDQAKRFSYDMGYACDKDGSTYWLPGTSTFRRMPDGTIRRVAKDFFGPGDVYCSVWSFFDLLQDGANGWGPSFSYEKSDVMG